MGEASPSTPVAPSAFNILQAPEDVQRSVLLALDNRELVLCKRVCRSFANLIENDIALKYKLELALFGRIDGTRPVAVIDRLTALREHRARFHAGDHPLTRASRFPLGFLSTRRGMAVGDSISLWGPATTFSGIDDLKIVHTVQGLGLEGYETGSCVVDLSQDLLVFSRRLRFNHLHAGTECCIYSLKDGQPHPLASKSHIRSNLDDRRSPCTKISDDIQVLGDLIAWNNLHGQREMKVINWKTGVVIWHLTTPEVRWHCRLISRAHVVVVTPHSLQIYSFDSHRGSPPSSSADHPALCVLELPAWSDNVFGVDLAYMSSYIKFPPTTGPNDSPLYGHDPELTVLAIHFEFRISTPTRKVFTDPYAIFVPVSSLKAHIAVPSQARIIPWEDWGPTGTRIIRFAKPCAVSTMGRSVAVTQKHWTRRDAALKILVFDVHPLAKQAQEPLKDAEGLLCTLRETPAFVDRIRTTFPFEFTVRYVPLGMRELYPQVVLTEDGLMLVMPSTSS